MTYKETIYFRHTFGFVESPVRYERVSLRQKYCHAVLYSNLLNNYRKGYYIAHGTLFL